MTERPDQRGGRSSPLEELPTDRLLEETQNLLRALAERVLESITERVEQASTRLIDYAEGGGPGLKAALSGARALGEGKSPLRAVLGAGATGLGEKVKGMFGGKGGGGKGGGKIKITNIVEQIDVGVPLRVAYNQWTQFEDFPSFMKKVESVQRTDETKLDWKAQIFWSHRTWESTIIEQVPDDRIVWRSKGPKGYVDGAVTFHEVTPNLTRILYVLEYHPQGFFEGTGNLWRAQGRRARLEIKHFRRHVMTRTILHPDEVEGWRGEIRDGELVKTHEDTLKEEQERAEEERTERAEEEEEPRGEERAERAEEEREEEPEEEEPRGERRAGRRSRRRRDEDDYDDEEPEERDEDGAAAPRRRR